MDTINVTLHPCKVSRRGKAAKGTLPIATFGIPVLDDAGIAKSWEYENLPAYTFEQVTEITNTLFAPVLGLMKQYDDAIRSETGQSMNKTNMLAARLLTEKVTDDKDDAKSLAAKYFQSAAFILENQGKEYTVEAYIADRKRINKAQGTKLVDNRVK